jgi:hypothetical protein
MQPHSIPIPKNTLSRNKKIAMKIAEQYTIYNAATILFSNVESPNSFARGIMHQQRVLAQLLLALGGKNTAFFTLPYSVCLKGFG